MESNKTVLVTGASRGIGRATAERFLKEGCIVYGTYFSSNTAAMEMQNAYKGKFHAVGPFDFTKISGIEKCIEELAGIEFDTLVLSAGVFGETDDFVNFSLDDFNRVMNCNFYAPLLFATKLQNYLKNNGNIVHMSSNDAYSGAFGSMSYTISKAAVISLCKCLCVNFGRRGIRVNSIAPGAIDTDMNTPQQVQESPLWTPINRIAQPYEVANVIYFLASSESSFINGENITIDGGYGNVSVLLKKEIEQNRQIKGYDYLIESFIGLKDGDVALCIDTTPEYGWIDNPNEIDYIKQNIEAQKRGAIIKRIIITSKDKENEVKQNSMITDYIAKIHAPGFAALVRADDVKNLFKSSFAKIGKGFGVFLRKNGQNEAFIDSFSSETDVGYVTSNKMVIDSLTSVYNEIENAIQTGKIKTLS